MVKSQLLIMIRFVYSILVTNTNHVTEKNYCLLLNLKKNRMNN